MNTLVVYVSLTVVIVVLWVVMIRLRNFAGHTLFSTARDSVIVAIIWPAALVLVLFCLLASLVSPPPKPLR